MDTQPDDILHLIFAHLPHHNRLLLSVCKRFFNLLKGSQRHIADPYIIIEQLLITSHTVSILPAPHVSISYHPTIILHLDHYADVCTLAARHNLINLLHLARFQQPPLPWDERTCTLAVQHGHLELFKFARINGCPYLPDIHEEAIRANHPDILDYILDSGCELDDDDQACILAIEHGQLTTLQKLNWQLCLENGDLCATAAKHGHMDILEWLRKHGADWNESEMTAWACFSGSRGMIKWLISNGCTLTPMCCSQAIAGSMPPGSTIPDAELRAMNILKWLRKKSCPRDATACAEAAHLGLLNILKWLRSEGCPWDPNTCSEAARGGHSEVLQWARSQNCPWSEDTFVGIIECQTLSNSDKLTACQQLRIQKCPWNRDVIEAAAHSGNLELVKWLHFQGCPWSSTTHDQAIISGNLELVKWLHSNNCPREPTPRHHRRRRRSHTHTQLDEINQPRSGNA